MNLLEKIAEIAVKKGLEVAWKEIEAALRDEAPELLPADLPHTDERYEDAVRKKRIELGLDPDGTDDLTSDGEP